MSQGVLEGVPRAVLALSGGTDDSGEGRADEEEIERAGGVEVGVQVEGSLDFGGQREGPFGVGHVFDEAVAQDHGHLDYAADGRE